MRKISLLILAGTLISCGGLDHPSYWASDPGSKADEVANTALQMRCEELKYDGYQNEWKMGLSQNLSEASPTNPMIALGSTKFEVSKINLEAVLQGAPKNLMPQAQAVESWIHLGNKYSDDRPVATQAMALIVPDLSVTQEDAGSVYDTYYSLQRDTETYRKLLMDDADDDLLEHFNSYLSLVYAVVGFRWQADVQALSSSYPEACSDEQFPGAPPCYKVTCRQVFSLKEFQLALDNEDGCVWLNGNADDYAYTCLHSDSACQAPIRWTLDETQELPVCVKY